MKTVRSRCWLILGLLAWSAAASEPPPPTEATSWTNFVLTNERPATVTVQLHTLPLAGPPPLGSGEPVITSYTVLPGQFMAFSQGWSQDITAIRWYVLDPTAGIVGASLILGQGNANPLNGDPMTLLGEYNNSTSGGVAPGPTIRLRIRPQAVLSDGVKTVWSLTDETLTANLYREGVDKIIDSVGSGGGSSGGAATEARQVTGNAYLENIDANLAAMRITDNNVYTDRLAGIAANESAPAAGAAAKTAVEAALPAVPAESGYSYPTPGTPNLAIQFPVIFGGAYFDFNPFTEARLGGVFTWFRFACHWLAVVSLGLWLWTNLRSWVTDANQVQQAKGNTLAMGTGGQATAFIAAAAMTAFILAAIVAVLAYSFDGLNLASVAVMAATNPMTGFLAGSYWMLDKVLPVATLLSCFLARYAFQMFAAKIYVGLGALVRFTVT